MRSTRLPEDRTSFRMGRMAVIAGIAAVALVARLYAPYVHHGPVLCPLHALAGLPCPGCGITRALCEIAAGNLAAAARLNALSLAVASAFALAMAGAAWELLCGRAVRMPRALRSRRAAWVVASVVMAYHIGRVAIGIYDGSLVRDYVKTSYTYMIVRPHLSSSDTVPHTR